MAIQRFKIENPDGTITVEIEGNTIRASLDVWGENRDQEITPDIPAPLRAAFTTIEDFAARPTFCIEAGEWEYLDDAGKQVDSESTIAMYDAHHGGGLVWSNEVVWGFSRGRLASMPDGTIVRDETISPQTLADGRTRETRYVPIAQIRSDQPVNPLIVEGLAAYDQNPGAYEVRAVEARKIRIPEGHEPNPAYLAMLTHDFASVRAQYERPNAPPIAVLETADGRFWAYDDVHAVAAYHDLAPTAMLRVVVIGRDERPIPNA